MQGVGGALQSGLMAIHAGMSELRDNAQQIAHRSIAAGTVSEDENRRSVVNVQELEQTEPSKRFADDTVRPMVGLLESSNQAKVGAKVLQIANDTIGSLLDIRA